MKKKFINKLFLSIIFFFIISVFMGIYLSLVYKRELSLIKNNFDDYIKINYGIVIDKLDSIAELNINNIIKDRSIIDELHRFKHATPKDRKDIRSNIFRKLYSYYNIALDKGIIIFDLYDLNRRIISFKNPELSDMNIEKNSLINEALSKNKLIKGYQFIDGRLVYSYNYPLVVDNEVIGGLSFGFSLYEIQNFLNKTTEYSFLILICGNSSINGDNYITKLSDELSCYEEDESLLKNISNKPNITKNIVIENPETITLQQDISTLSYKNKTYILFLNKIAEVEKNNIFILSSKETDMVNNAKKRYALHFIMGTFFNLFLSLTLWFLLVNRLKIYESEKFLSYLLNYSKSGITVYNNDFSLKFVNDTIRNFIGNEENIINLIKRLSDDYGEFDNNGKKFIYYKNYLSISNLSYYMLSIIDITELASLRDKFKLSDEIIQNSLNAILITDKDSIIININEAFTRITGYTKEEVLGKKSSILKSGIHDKQFYDKMWSSIKNTGKWEGEIWNKRKDNQIYPSYLSLFTIYDEKGNSKYYVGVFTDITDIKKYEERLEFLAYYNEVSRLPNKRSFLKKLKEYIQNGDFNKLAISYIDLDSFKVIIDNYGLETANKVINEILNRLLKILKNNDIIAHFDEDIFVIATDVKEDENIHEYLIGIQRNISNPIKIQNEFFTITASMGVTIYPDDKESEADLVQHARQALFSSKLKGKNRIAYYNVANEKNAVIYRKKIAQIEEGIKNEEFIFYLQPKVDIDKKSIIGIELLIRWFKGEDSKILPPSEFINYIYNSELAIEFDKYVIRKAIYFVKTLIEKGIYIKTSINISPKIILENDFLQYVKFIIEEADVSPDMIEFEVVESTTISDLEKASYILHELSNLGFDISIDDFGTGYASLDYIKSLPVTTVKIDKTFITDILIDPTNLNITETLILLSRSFNKNLVAEGVEDLKTAQVLYKLGCKVIQGYLITKPISKNEFLQQIKDLYSLINYLDINEDMPYNKDDIEIYSAINGFIEILKTIDYYDRISHKRLQFNLMLWLRNRGELYFNKISRYKHIVEDMIKIMKLIKKLNDNNYNKSEYSEIVKNLHAFLDRFNIIKSDIINI